MADSAFPAAIDALVSLTVTPLRAVNATVVISDGVPTEGAQDEVVFGLTPTDEATEGAQDFITFSNAPINEEFDIPIVFSSYRGGASQKVARDACYVLFNAFLTWLRSERTLGGAVMAVTEIRNKRDTPTKYDATRERGEGRRHTIEFDLHCKAHI